MIIAFEWRCKFDPNEYFTNVGSRIYSCVRPDDFEITESCVTIDFVSGSHFQRRTNQDVLAVWHKTSHETLLTCFPRGFSSAFPNLLAVGFYNTKIKEISKENLKEFGDQLKYFRLAKSHLEKIDADLFYYNYKIQTIGLDHNRISIIDYKAFIYLSKLKALWFIDNLCIDESAANKLDVIKLISEIKEKIKCA